ncbi:alpha/beta hydrolase [Leifsonia sp. NPDC058292]|uniref:alpha/beta hydrolase n=1 Tax=Leifsonia sp. NPDC058292 TaxID=3346428 RepID=UPI0036DA3C9A
MLGSITQLVIPGPSGPIGARLYAPTASGAAEGDAPPPALVWLHGGGFSGGDLDMPEAHWVGTALAERGHPVVTVDYRLVTDTVRYPVPSNDVLAAWAWVLDHRSELNITGTVHLGGASAGGNLAAGAALRLRDKDPSAVSAEVPKTVILAYPTLHSVQPEPSDELAAHLQTIPVERRNAPGYVKAMYARFLPALDADAGPALYAAVPGAADPSGLPPILIAGSTVDMLRASAEDFVASLAAHGVQHEYFVEADTEHGHLNRPEAPAATATIDRFHSWLSSHAVRGATDS